MKKINLILPFILCQFINGQCQTSVKYPRYFAEPIMTDSASTLFLPTRYNEEFLSVNKILIGGDYYANIVIYDFIQDTYKKLFEVDTYIKSFQGSLSYMEQLNPKPKNVTSKWVFFLVKNKDSNDNRRIDERDPTVLFVTSSSGKDLKPLTPETENIVSLQLFEKQGFGLIKIQRDLNKDNSFKMEDTDFYFRKINLNDLSLGRPIELK
jgi:hypothetical protein